MVPSNVRQSDAAKEADDVQIRAYRAKTPEERVNQAFEMFDFARVLLVGDVERDHPGLPKHEIERLATERMLRCFNMKS